MNPNCLILVVAAMAVGSCEPAPAPTQPESTEAASLPEPGSYRLTSSSMGLGDGPFQDLDPPSQEEKCLNAMSLTQFKNWLRDEGPCGGGEADVGKGSINIRQTCDVPAVGPVAVETDGSYSADKIDVTIDLNLDDGRTGRVTQTYERIGDC